MKQKEKKGKTTKSLPISTMLKILIALFGVVGIWLIWYGAIIEGIISIIAGTGICFGYRYTSADPTVYKATTVWGELTGEHKKEGWDLFAPYWPFIYSFEKIDMTRVDDTFDIRQIRCKIKEGEIPTKSSGDIKSGGSVDLLASITIEPDKIRMPELIRNGKLKGVLSKLKSIMSEDVRQMGRLRSWEEMTFASDLLSAQLILKIVGENAKPFLPAEFDDLMEKAPGDEDAQVKARKLLQQALTNGIADIHNLGIKIRRLNVDKVDEEEDLRKAAAAQAKEILDRRKESYELGTDIQLAQVLYDESNKNGTKGKKTMEDWILEVRRRRNIAEKQGQVYDINFSGTSADILNKFLGGEK